MNPDIKNVFKGYLYGYLNSFKIDMELKVPSLSYKEFKTVQIAKYMNISKKYIHIFSIIMIIVSKIECTVSMLILSYKFIKYSMLFLLTTRKSIKNSNIMLGFSIKRKERFIKLLESIDLDKNDVVLIQLYSNNDTYNEFTNVSLFSGIKYLDIIKSFIYSIKILFLMKKKYGKQDFLFRAYSAFEYFLFYFFVLRSCTSNTYYFYNLIDRWAYLFGNTIHKTCLIQHGILSKGRKVRKIGRVDCAYYISMEQKEICERILFYNVPHAYYRKTLLFSSNNKLLHNELKNILLVCNLYFLEKEKTIIQDISKRNANLYIKPHPLDINIEDYKNLLKDNNFVILEVNDYPEVDIVISYKSTLADEYENNGVIVLRYTDESFAEKYQELCENC